MYFILFHFLAHASDENWHSPHGCSVLILYNKSSHKHYNFTFEEHYANIH